MTYEGRVNNLRQQFYRAVLATTLMSRCTALLDKKLLSLVKSYECMNQVHVNAFAKKTMIVGRAADTFPGNERLICIALVNSDHNQTQEQRTRSMSAGSSGECLKFTDRKYLFLGSEFMFQVAQANSVSRNLVIRVLFCCNATFSYCHVIEEIGC